jgi:hypothetical protein
MAGQQPVGGGNLVPVNFEISCLDIHESVLAFILWAEVWQHVPLIDCIAALGELFFAVPRLR